MKVNKESRRYYFGRRRAFTHSAKLIAEATAADKSERRARLQPCHNRLLRTRALASEVHFSRRAHRLHRLRKNSEPRSRLQPCRTWPWPHTHQTGHAKGGPGLAFETWDPPSKGQSSPA
jgi:hypothetical protein